MFSQKNSKYQYLLIGVVVGIVIYAMGWLPASLTAMFNKKVQNNPAGTQKVMGK